MGPELGRYIAGRIAAVLIGAVALAFAAGSILTLAAHPAIHFFQQHWH